MLFNHTWKRQFAVLHCLESHCIASQCITMFQCLWLRKTSSSIFIRYRFDIYHTQVKNRKTFTVFQENHNKQLVSQGTFDGNAQNFINSSFNSVYFLEFFKKYSLKNIGNEQRRIFQNVPKLFFHHTLERRTNTLLLCYIEVNSNC